MPGVEHTVGISGQSLILNANAPNLGSMYVLLKPFDERHDPKLSADAIAKTLAGPLPRGSAGGDRLGLRRTADRRPGHHRRLQADRRGPRQSRPRAIAAGQRARSSTRRQQTDGLHGPVQQLRGQHALALPGHRPHQVHGPRRAGQRHLQHAAGLPRLLLRQQLQRVRPDLAGERPGRSEIPRPRRRHPATPGPQQPGTDGPPGHAAGRPRHERAGDGHALQHVLRGGHHRQRRARHQLRPGDLPDARDRRQGTAALDGHGVDRPGLPAAPGRATRRCTSSPWRWSSSSWCWRPSTKAGRCRWP